jgi:UDPglucose--hexose-1-phosphate uridylyltransferase
MNQPQLRHDPITDRWVLIAPERFHSLEPNSELPPDTDPCPFCEGREFETEAELLAVREPGSRPDGPGWRVRVVPNKFPSVRPGASAAPPGAGLLAGLPGRGQAEVVVECPGHLASLADLPAGRFRELLGVYRDRLVSLAEDPAVAYAQVFKNHGLAAGASLAHSHSQIVALPAVPVAVQQELDAAAAYHARTGRCVFCDLIAQELTDGSRVVRATPHFAAVAAYAGRFPYETWLLPRRHAARYEQISADELDDLAGLLHWLLVRIGAVAGQPAYNFFLHTAPLNGEGGGHFHWHWEVLPRMTGTAGFEWATGCNINPVPPEEAAARLRAG